MINKILEKGLLGIKTVKVFKAYNLPKDTANKKPAGLFQIMKKAGGSKYEAGLSPFSGDKRHYRNSAGAFNCRSQFPLMVGAIARDSTGHDLASLGNEIAENGRIFIINLYIGISTKAAKLFSMKKLLLGLTSRSFSVRCGHCLFPPRWLFFFVVNFSGCRFTCPGIDCSPVTLMSSLVIRRGGWTFAFNTDLRPLHLGGRNFLVHAFTGNGAILFYGHEFQYAIVDFEISFNFRNNRAVAGEVDQKIKSIFLFVDFVGEASLAPFVYFGDHTITFGNDGLTAVDDSGDTLINQIRFDNSYNFVSFQFSSFRL
jgi:hypothetical protein